MAKLLVASQEELSSMELVCFMAVLLTIADSLQIIPAVGLQWVEIRRPRIMCLIYVE
jgi:hypothetical protein